ncbi:MAG: ribonuclease P protein component [Nakamurella sp.]
MLPSASRLHTSDQFRQVTRSGNRGAAATVVVHLRHDGVGAAARVGFVVSKKVGNSVVRHRVVRRLRAVVSRRLASLPSGTDIVVRALPAAADAASAVFDADFSLALRRAEGRKRR